MKIQINKVRRALQPYRHAPIKSLSQATIESISILTNKGKSLTSRLQILSAWNRVFQRSIDELKTYAANNAHKSVYESTMSILPIKDKGESFIEEINDQQTHLTAIITNTSQISQILSQPTDIAPSIDDASSEIDMDSLEKELCEILSDEDPVLNTRPLPSRQPQPPRVSYYQQQQQQQQPTRKPMLA